MPAAGKAFAVGERPWLPSDAARSHLGGPAAWGAITAAESVGLIAGGLMSLRFSPRRPILFVVGMGMTIAVPTLSLAMLWPLPLVCVCAFGAGLAMEAEPVPTETLAGAAAAAEPVAAGALAGK